MDSLKPRQGAIAAGWMGILVGVGDALAAFLHPVNPTSVPFAVTFYGLLFMAAYGLLVLVGRLLWPRHHVRFALAASVAAVPGLLGVALVVASASAFMRTGPGLVLGFGVVAAVCYLTLRVVWTVMGGTRMHLPFPGRLTGTVLAAALLVWPVLWIGSGAAFPRGRTAGDEEPPRGLVLVSMDAMRGDRVSAHGYGRPTTPVLDGLVADGLSFTRAYVQSPCSAPSHASMLTGLPPLSHGVLENMDLLDARVETVAERLRESGFSTAAFLNNFYLEHRFGFAQGFDVFLNGRQASRVSGFLPWQSLHTLSFYQLWHRLWHRPGQRTGDSIEGALEWLRHRPDGDFFLFLHIMDPHSPYAPPPDLRDRFYRPEGEPVVDTVELRERMADLTPREIAALRDLYDADVALADRKLGAVVAELKRQGIYDSTLLVVTGDHGEVLYEKDDTFDHGLIWEGNLVVPLVLNYPLTLPPGEVVERPVAVTDLVPTAFSVLGVPYREQTGADFHTSLWPVPKSDPLVMTLTGVTNRDYAGAVGPRYKLISRHGRVHGFYDLLADPGEMNDLWPRLAGPPNGDTAGLRLRADEMSAALDRWLDQSRSAAVVDSVRRDDQFDYDTERRLRALGY